MFECNIDFAPTKQRHVHVYEIDFNFLLLSFNLFAFIDIVLCSYGMDIYWQNRVFWR